MTSRRSFLRLGALSTVALAGCSEPGSSDTPTATPTPESTPGDSPSVDATVGMSCNTSEGRYFFAPDLVQVPVGGTVSWSPTSPCRQSTIAYHPDNDAPLRIPEGADPWESPPIQGDRGGSFEYTFELAGVYDYFGLHEGAGQVGTVVVGDPDPEGQPGLTEPSAALPEAARTKLRELNRRTRELL